MRQTAGKIMPLPRGAYDEIAEYGILDIVTYDNKLWICKKSGTTGVTPTKTAAEWMMCVDGTTDVSALETELQEKIDGYDTRLTEISTNIDSVNDMINTINIDSINDQINATNETITSLTSVVDEVTSKVVFDTEPTKDSTKLVSSGTVYDLFHNADKYITESSDLQLDHETGLTYKSVGKISGIGGETNIHTDSDISARKGVSYMSSLYESSKYQNRARMILYDDAGAKIEHETWSDGTPNKYSSVSTANGEVRLSAGIGTYSSNGNMGVSPKNYLLYNGSSLIDPSATCFLGVQAFPFRSIYASNIYVNGSPISTSDRNEKKDIAEIIGASDFIMGLKPVSYKFINGSSGRTHYGLIAQDVEELLSELGMTSTDFAGFVKTQRKDENNEPIEGEYTYGLRYEEFIAPLISMCQNLQTEVQNLKMELKTLKKG